jgi:UDP-N-acetylmuramoyl-tripeptide--D-alanyl-D-alanine ligase
MTALWTVDAMADAMGAQRQGAPPSSICGIAIDSRTIAPGEAFFAIADRRDGHDFVAAALAARAGLAVVAAERRAQFAGDLPLLVVPDVLAGLRALAAAARARTAAKVIGVTGSVGKTGTKEALRLALSSDGKTHASTASYNNHWGVPLSLARCPADARYTVLEMGMNHAGEIAPLTRLARPHIALITTIAPVHLEFFGSLAKIADAKAEIFLGVEEPGGAAVLNRDIAQFARLKRRAEDAGVTRIVSFGEHAKADARLLKCVLHPHCSTVVARIFETELTYKIGAPGRHIVDNSLAVLATAVLAGADLALAALALSQFKAAAGRGAPIEIEVSGGQALVIDESYNANPVSVAAALALLGQAVIGPRGRRIAVLGDMLELGDKGPALHRALAKPVIDNGVDLVFCCGPLMRELWQILPASRRGFYAEDSAALEPQVVAALRAGDVVMVKGSLGSRMGPIVKALQRAYPQAPPLDDHSLESASAQG